MKPRLQKIRVCVEKPCTECHGEGSIVDDYGPIKEVVCSECDGSGYEGPSVIDLKLLKMLLEDCNE